MAQAEACVRHINIAIQRFGMSDDPEVMPHHDVKQFHLASSALSRSQGLHIDD